VHVCVHVCVLCLHVCCVCMCVVFACVLCLHMCCVCVCAHVCVSMCVGGVCVCMWSVCVVCLVFVSFMGVLPFCTDFESLLPEDDITAAAAKQYRPVQRL